MSRNDGYISHNFHMYQMFIYLYRYLYGYLYGYAVGTQRVGFDHVFFYSTSQSLYQSFSMWCQDLSWMSHDLYIVMICCKQMCLHYLNYPVVDLYWLTPTRTQLQSRRRCHAIDRCTGFQRNFGRCYCSMLVRVRVGVRAQVSGVGLELGFWLAALSVHASSTRKTRHKSSATQKIFSRKSGCKYKRASCLYSPSSVRIKC